MLGMALKLTVGLPVNIRPIPARLRAPLLVAIGGILVTVFSAGFFHWEADREAQEEFELRSRRYALTVQMCLQEAIGASRSIRSIAEQGDGRDLSRLRSLARSGEDESSPLHSIRWIAFLAPMGADVQATPTTKAASITVIAAGRGAPVPEDASLPLTQEFLQAVTSALRTGKPILYLPEDDKDIRAPLYLNPIKASGKVAQAPMVLALALDEQMLIDAGLKEFLASDSLAPIGTYAVRVLARPSGDDGGRERLMVETAKLGQEAPTSLQRFLTQGMAWLEHQSSVELDGIRYRIVTAASRAEINVPADSTRWWVLAIGLAATLLLSLTTARIAMARDSAEDTSRQLGSLVRSSEARFRNLVESTRDWMWETDAAGVITFSSGRVHALLGVTPREIIGKRCADFGFDMDLESAAAAGMRVELGVKADGEREVWLQCACSRFNDELGQLAGYRGVCSDVTEARGSADRQRVLELEFNRIDKLGTLDHVMSMVAHELNQPLAAVASYCGGSVRMLRRNPANMEDVISSMNAAASQAQVAAATVRGIRQFIVQQEPSIGSHQIGALIENAISLAGFRLDRARIRVESLRDRNLPAVLADQILIVQVLLNLLHNAIDAVSEISEPRIVVRAELQGDGRVRVSVEDNGPGMTDEQLARSVEPYVTTKTTGLGLGLSISQAIVESHGGVLKLGRNALGGCTAEFTVEADTTPKIQPEVSRIISRRSR